MFSIFPSYIIITRDVIKQEDLAIAGIPRFIRHHIYRIMFLVKPCVSK